MTFADRDDAAPVADLLELLLGGSALSSAPPPEALAPSIESASLDPEDGADRIGAIGAIGPETEQQSEAEIDRGADRAIEPEIQPET
ncbi:MAG: hypothetical protein ACO34J_17210, partial [Prochlorothrix sp.]